MLMRLPKHKKDTVYAQVKTEKINLEIKEMKMFFSQDKPMPTFLKMICFKILEEIIRI